MKDKISNLPDSPAVKFGMFSGQIPISEGKKIFQWFVEAQSNPDSAPLLLWTNGGPGCSGLGGMLSEMGPFNAAKKGLVQNQYAWNRLANMVFIEQPAGVGFSKTDAKTTGDDQAAEDNYTFIKEFLDKFDDLKSHDFYLTSESQGGHQLPTLAWNLVSKGGVPNFKGFAVGNPLTWMPYRNQGQYGTYCGHQLIPKDVCDQYVSNGCDADTKSVQNPSKECQSLTSTMDKLTSKLDPQALDFPTCPTGGPLSSEVEYETVRHFQRFFLNKASSKPAYAPCSMGQAGTYLNRADVQKAIHAEPTKWEMCSDVGYSQADVLKPMMPVQEKLMQHKLKIMVQSGDDDSICATNGSQRWIWQVGGKPTQEWQTWTVKDPVQGKQIAGQFVEFEGFSFHTVHGAGHMVPQTRPIRGFELLQRFLGVNEDSVNLRTSPAS